MTIVKSQTLFPVQGFEHRFYHGNRYHCVSAKVTLEWDADGTLTVPRRQPDMEVNDIWHDREDRSSLLYASDLIPFKPGTDVVVTGTVRPPVAEPVPFWFAALRIGTLEKRLRLYGPRQWEHRLLGGWTLSDPVPTEGVSLLYENAYGGTVDPDKDEYKEGEYYPPNPAGTGYIGKSRPDTGRIYSAAQIEAWDGAIKEFGRDVPVGGFGPIPGHIPERMQYAGTFDDKWKKEIAPDIPPDMDMRYWNIAPAGQRLDRYLKPSDEIELAAMRPGPPIRLLIPNIDASTLCEFADRSREAESMNLDSVAIDLDGDRMTLRYHRIIPFDPDLKRIQVGCALLPNQPRRS